MKKILCAAVLVLTLASAVFAAASVKIGMLSKLNIEPEDFAKFLLGLPTAKFQEFRSFVVPGGRSFKFYDSLNAMFLALNAGDVDEINLPKDVANYAMRMNDNYEVAGIVVTEPKFLSIGFKDDEKGQRLKSLFNNAIITLENNGYLAVLQNLYIKMPGIGEPEPVVFENFKGAETVKVAVTGDMPPIDFIAEDGVPAGFNTAVLAEIAKIANVNIELVNIDSTARGAALVSGRVDAVFWFQSTPSSRIDVPEGVILTEPYFTWTEDIELKKK